MSTFAWFVILMLGYLSVGTKVAALVAHNAPDLVPPDDNKAFGWAVLLWPLVAVLAVVGGIDRAVGALGGFLRRRGRK